MSPLVKVIKPGFHSTLQDAGRRGHQDIGVPVSGPLDRLSFVLANGLVGNALDAACLELIGSGPECEILAPSVRLALVGGSAQIDILGRDEQAPAGQSLRAVKGDVVRIRLGGEALCSYLAFEGGFDAPLCLGSLSTYTRAAFGGLSGRALLAGDILHGHRDDVPARTELALPAAQDLQFAQPIRIVLGPQDDYFDAASITLLLSSTYTIAPASDRMGFRMAGPALHHSRGYNIVSDGIVAGSMQVPGSGLPIVLMADAQTTGGYPKVATVISADLPLLGRRKAGQTVTFKAVTRVEAEAARRSEHAAIQATLAALRPAGDADGINVDALARHNLIGGVVDATRP
ncbi:biotin-dependent carboxyltransferase family protein [Bradyrhizobium sp. U87765 SZCCT0131]|uniref:5-oxoprolinase subunit C family protein n=1 Tax=unclassified Bradyrhizobium TaxID=2631580 RepID=UPI001BA7B50C|nr:MULTISPECIES: biotin-dependent carboxyltransferase family protein [unclassified Bradyrhizobium]MBR1221747.1 biotin-dependent carboxyltransferase family protein [Bradyrhizobium sp. U87765 SZCCT0131]MBR1264330.1 biotin-dependent carboxyltransferase family protein [Bradyrhizobium sp. U87765 SZCCT0134]MBR1304763.1 biotin-dependent carboxyltransferase family protein [Bradyrhizobium sp. U87765 SZCCT0110]MBR1324099.1 biotin-dependent carboxyltransferase family protein [Bradyrhizobium sp. U87765 SZC